MNKKILNKENKDRIKKSKGFTLMEILVVSLIIVVIAAIAYPLYTKSIAKVRAAEAVNLLEIVRAKQINRYVLTRGYYNSFASMGQLTQNRSKEEVDSGDSTKMKVGDYELAMDTDGECLTATYDKGGTKFTFSARYEKEGIGCTGDICNSFGNVIAGSAEDVCAAGSNNGNNGDNNGDNSCTPGDISTEGCIGGQKICGSTGWGDCECPLGMSLQNGECKCPTSLPVRLNGKCVECTPGDIKRRDCSSSARSQACTEEGFWDGICRCYAYGDYTFHARQCGKEANKELDPDSPACGCKCKPNFTQSGNTCTCKTLSSAIQQCKTYSSPKGSWNNATCQCDCPSGSFGFEGTIYYGIRGIIGCTTCPAGQVETNGVCACENESAKQTACQTANATTNTQGTWKTISGSPQCSCACPTNMEHKTTGCECTAKAKSDCGNIYGEFDNTTCGCPCPANKEIHTWGPYRGKCGCKNNTGSTIETSAEYFCTENSNSDLIGTWNETTCNCTCPEGTEWTTRGCDYDCGYGAVWNKTAGKCECENEAALKSKCENIPSGGTWNSWQEKLTNANSSSSNQCKCSCPNYKIDWQGECKCKSNGNIVSVTSSSACYCANDCHRDDSSGKCISGTWTGASPYSADTPWIMADTQSGADAGRNSTRCTTTNGTWTKHNAETGAPVCSCKCPSNSTLLSTGVCCSNTAQDNCENGSYKGVFNGSTCKCGCPSPRKEVEATFFVGSTDNYTTSSRKYCVCEKDILSNTNGVITLGRLSEPCSQTKGTWSECECTCNSPRTYLDRSTGECKCPLGSKAAACRSNDSGGEWSDITCSCNCSHNNNPKTSYNSTTGKCECPSPKVYQNGQCECDPAAKKKCEDSDGIWTSGNCACSSCSKPCRVPQNGECVIQATQAWKDCTKNGTDMVNLGYTCDYCTFTYRECKDLCTVQTRRVKRNAKRKCVLNGCDAYYETVQSDTNKCMPDEYWSVGTGCYQCSVTNRLIHNNDSVPACLCSDNSSPKDTGIPCVVNN